MTYENEYLEYESVFNKVQEIIKYDLTETSRHSEQDVTNACKKIVAIVFDKVLEVSKATWIDHGHIPYEETFQSEYFNRVKEFTKYIKPL